MRLIKSSVCLAAALQACFALSQGAAAIQRGAQPAREAKATTAPKVSAGGPNAGYRSPFADYRAFDADVPLKDWRRANDEVRDAGGHVGLMKGADAQPTVHEAHGARTPAPSGSGK